MSRATCICGRNAGTERCNYCHRFTCAYCHHGSRHLELCDETRQRET